MSFVVVKIRAWICASGVAVILCVAYTVGLVVLWVRGLCGIEEWRRQKRADKHGARIRGTLEKRVVRGRRDPEKRSIRRTGSVHFSVDSLLQSTTGLDLEHLLEVVKKRHTGHG